MLQFFTFNTYNEAAFKIGPPEEEIVGLLSFYSLIRATLGQPPTSNVTDSTSYVLRHNLNLMLYEMQFFQVQCFKKTSAFDKSAVCLLYVKKETFTLGCHCCNAGRSWLYYCRCALLAVLVSL